MMQKLKIKHSGMARLEWRHLLRVEDGMVTLETLEDAALAEHNAQAMVRLFNAKVKDHQPVHREIRAAGLDAVLIIRWVASLFMGSRLHNRNKAFGVAEGFGGVRPAPSFALQGEGKPAKTTEPATEDPPEPVPPPPLPFILQLGRAFRSRSIPWGVILVL